MIGNLAHQRCFNHGEREAVARCASNFFAGNASPSTMTA
jgi:hypothetical protein